ncbi:hypothetical protein Ancab_037649 [Ancistrocladus abbreviatus]
MGFLVGDTLSYRRFVELVAGFTSGNEYSTFNIAEREAQEECLEEVSVDVLEIHGASRAGELQRSTEDAYLLALSTIPDQKRIRGSFKAEDQARRPRTACLCCSS